jgi:hypothetical protein
VVVLNEPVYRHEPEALGIEAREPVGNRLSDSNRAVFKHAAEEAFLYSNWRLARRRVANKQVSGAQKVQLDLLDYLWWSSNLVTLLGIIPTGSG